MSTPDPALTIYDRACHLCKDADSWGFPDRQSCYACFPTKDGWGTLFVPLNPQRQPQKEHK